ncbi:hypothetical protein [Enterobacter kobei]|uniref:hypothetical protein n=1 Tax=Enterobacter kobei TaxID=208224 RepID=UPI003CE6C3BA
MNKMPTISRELFGPSIEGVNNNTIWVVDLSEPVLVDIFPWAEMLDGDVVMLTLSGRDAAGDLVPDKTFQHTLSSIDVGQKLVFEVNKADISVYGENGHVGETGTLVMFYTVNGLRSAESIFAVHGVAGSDIYTLHSVVEANNAQADGISFNTVNWSVTNQSGTEVSGLTATASVTGNALINRNGLEAESVQITLPASLNYVDSSAETVIAEVMLNETSNSGSASLSFSAGPESQCQQFTIDNPGYHSMAALLSSFDVIPGTRYKLTIQYEVNEAQLSYCKDGYYFDNSMRICMQGSPDYAATEVPGSDGNEMYFVIPSQGSSLTSNSYLILHAAKVVFTLCIEPA